MYSMQNIYGSVILALKIEDKEHMHRIRYKEGDQKVTIGPMRWDIEYPKYQEWLKENDILTADEIAKLLSPFFSPKLIQKDKLFLQKLNSRIKDTELSLGQRQREWAEEELQRICNMAGLSYLATSSFASAITLYYHVKIGIFPGCKFHTEWATIEKEREAILNITSKYLQWLLVNNKYCANDLSKCLRQYGIIAESIIH